MCKVLVLQSQVFRIVWPENTSSTSSSYFQHTVGIPSQSELKRTTVMWFPSCDVWFLIDSWKILEIYEGKNPSHPSHGWPSLGIETTIVTLGSPDFKTLSQPMPRFDARKSPTLHPIGLVVAMFEKGFLKELPSLAIQHSCRKSPCLMGKSTLNGHFQ